MRCSGRPAAARPRLLNLISGLLRPTEGRILFDGVDVTDASPEERNIAQVFQFPVIYDTMTVYDNLAFPLRNRGVPEAEVDRRVREIADMLELDAMLDRRASGLTADGKQKISLGRGLVRSDVNVIMFDEPLTVIDPHLKWVLRSKLKELHQRIRRTMIYVTHDQTEALTFADQVVVMNDGEVVQIGTPVELFERPQPHLRRPFHRLAGHECAALRRRGRQGAVFAGHADRDRQCRSLSRQRQDAGARRAAGIRQLRPRRHPGRHRQGRSMPGATASSRRATASTAIKLLVPRGRRRCPQGSAHVRFDPEHTQVYADGWLVK